MAKEYKLQYTANEINQKLGAVDNKLDASALSIHNTSTVSHNDIRELISGLSTRLNTVANSDDTTLDQLSEIVAYIKANKGLIDGITTSKVNVADIVDNLTTGVSNKPLSAKQGVALKSLIDTLTTNKLDASSLTSAVEQALATAKASGEFNGKNGVGIASISQSVTSTEDDGINIITVFTDDDKVYNFEVKNGSKGSSGANGKTPVKGTDYWTPADKEGIVNEILTSLDTNIPDYVISEAESVIDRVIAAQGARTFTFASITDLHFGNSSYTDGVKHACAALKYIDSRVKLDAVAVLGDYTDGYPATGLSNAIADFKDVNSVLNDLRFTVNLRQQGNHDYYEGNFPTTNRFIQSYSDDVVWGDKLGGYYYRDFSDYKLRVISLNTVEEGNAKINCSAKQYEWFVSSLDLSAKADAEDWQILILSHHPLDWWSDDSNAENNYWYRLPKIVYGYKKGLNSATASGYGTSFTPAFDFSQGNNKAKIICNIHGHIHNLLTAKMYLNIGATSAGNTGVYRMATPEACMGRANGYDGVWHEDTSYDKVANTAKDTSFVIYCIDLDTNIIRAICYGAGYDRTLNYVSEKTYYSVINTLTGVTTNNTAISVEENEAYTATLSANNPITSVVVTMGGVDVTSQVYSNGVITIPSVTGNVEITATASTYTNLLKSAVASDGTPYNDGKGWKADTRLNSSGVEAAYTGVEVTGFIPIKKGDVIYFDNIRYHASGSGTYANQEYLTFYDANKNLIAGGLLSYIAGFFEDGYAIVSKRTPVPNVDLKILDTTELLNWNSNRNKWSNCDNMAYFRISAEEITDNSIITINEPIE